MKYFTTVANLFQFLYSSVKEKSSFADFYINIAIKRIHQIYFCQSRFNRQIDKSLLAMVVGDNKLWNSELKLLPIDSSELKNPIQFTAYRFFAKMKINDHQQ